MGKGISFALLFGVLTSSSLHLPLDKDLNRALEIPKLRPVVEIYNYTEQQRVEQSKRVFQAQRLYGDREKTCLAKNIYFEAKNQSIKGQVAVALVTMNRVLSPYYADDVCEVVYQRKQFSWYWDGKPDVPVDLRSYDRALKIADAILSQDSAFVDFTNGADHYHADYVMPAWREHMLKIVKVDSHIFYRAYDTQSL